MSATTYHYKQLLDPKIYEETRQNLARVYKRDIQDHEVDKHYDKLRLDLEKSHGISLSIESLKEIFEFSSKFQAYYDAWDPERYQSIKPLDGFGRRLYVITCMHQEGHHVPQLILKETKRHNAELAEEKEFFTSMLNNHGTDREGIRNMYREYRDWRIINFPGEKIVATPEFRETLRYYLLNKTTNTQQEATNN